MSNWWEAGGASGCVAAYDAIGAASLAASYTDLSGNGNDLTVATLAPEWAAGIGWGFPTNRALETGITPDGSAMTVIVRFSDPGTGALIGQYSGNNTSRIGLLPDHQGNKMYFASGNLVNLGDVLSGESGVMAVAGTRGYLDGVELTSALSGPTTAASYSLWIGKQNGGAEEYRGNIQAVAIYNTELDASEIAAVTTAMQALGGDGNWWTSGGASGAVAVYDAISAASLAASYTDLSGSGNDAAPGVAPTWAAGTGWTFDATQYLATGITPGDDYTVICRYSNATSGNSKTVAGAWNYEIKPYFFGSLRFVVGASTLNAGSGSAAGVLAMTGRSGAYFDGVSLGALSGSGGAVQSALIIGGGHGASPSPSAYEGNVEAFAMFDGELDASEVAAVTTAMQALPTASGSALPAILTALAGAGRA